MRSLTARHKVPVLTPLFITEHISICIQYVVSAAETQKCLSVLDIFVDTADCRRRHFGHSPHPCHPAIQHSSTVFMKWAAKSNKLGEKHFWTTRIWNWSCGDVSGGEMRRQEKNNKALFFPLAPLVSSTPPTPGPNPLCRPAGKGRPAAKARAAGKTWWLPSRSGGSSGGGVAPSFVLP